MKDNYKRKIKISYQIETEIFFIENRTDNEILPDPDRENMKIK